LRAGTEVIHDEAWKEQVRKHKGIVLSIDGIQPANGNETMYLMRDVLTGRILHAEHVTESTKERLKEILGPVVALNVPVLGVISDAQPTELQAVAELWPDAPHQICQLHILEQYAAMVEGALNIDGLKPFGYAGLQMQEALSTIQTSLEKLEKGGEL